MLSRRTVGTYQGNELTRNSPRSTRPQSSHLTELLWTDPGLKSGIAVRELTSTSEKKEKKEKRWRGINRSRKQEKAITIIKL